MNYKLTSISAEYVSCIDLVGYIVEYRVVAVGDDGLRYFLKLIKIIYDGASKEGSAVF